MEFEIEGRQPAAVHTVSVMQLRRWIDGVAVSPDDVLKRRRLKQLRGN
jgi:hypothetical protein